MSDFRVEVRYVKIYPHPDADKVQLAQVDEFQAVVEKDRFQDNTLVAYIPEQAIVPDYIVDELHLEGKLAPNNRLKPARFRGILSQGLVYVPLTGVPLHWIEGLDVTEELGVTKYEPKVPVNMAGKVYVPPSNALVNGGIQTYTDIENIKKYPNILQDGEIVRVAEKEHGCLDGNTLVTLESGSMVPIKNLVPGDVVLGFDGKQVVPSLVLNCFNNGFSGNWVKVHMSAYKDYRKSPIICTDNHEFLVDGNYVRASDLVSGMSVTRYRNKEKLSYIQEQILAGMLLGDASLKISGESAFIEWGHSEKQADYCEWIRSNLGNTLNPTINYRISGYGSKIIVGKTRQYKLIYRSFSNFIDTSGKKIVPKDIYTLLSPISMAFWYMDDGCLSHNDKQQDRASLAVCGFDADSCKLLQNALRKFGIDSALYYTSNAGNETLYPRLRINADSADIFFTLISPYIPGSMQYKLPTRYRGHDAWIAKEEYRPELATQKITKIDKININLERFDIETETHNFFANGVLVHNSCLIITKQGNQYFVSSKGIAARGFVLQEEDSNIYWRVVRQYNLFDKLKTISEFCPDFDPIYLYGEVIGVQDLMYGLKPGELAFYAFDLRYGDTYLSYDDFIPLCAHADIPTVPLLYKGPYTRDVVNNLTSGRSVLDPGTIREGVVVRAEPPRYDMKLGRVVLKSISEEYLLRKNKNATEFQ